MEEKIYIFDNTKLSKTETSNYTFKELIILNPKLLEEICNSARYYDKKSSNCMGYQMYFGVEQILFLF